MPPIDEQDTFVSVAFLTSKGTVFCSPGRYTRADIASRKLYVCLFMHAQRGVCQIPPATAGGLWPDSTAVPRTFGGARFWLRRLSHQGHVTTAPLPSSPAG